MKKQTRNGNILISKIWGEDMIELSKILEIEEMAVFIYDRTNNDITVKNIKKIINNDFKKELEEKLKIILKDKFFICENNCEGEYFDVFYFHEELIKIKWEIEDNTAIGTLRIDNIYNEKKEIIKINETKDFLLEISQKVVEYDDINELLEKILINVMDIIEISKSGSILILDEETGFMTPQVIIGFDDKTKEVKIKPEETYHFVASKGNYESTVIIQDLLSIVNNKHKHINEIYTDKGELIRSNISAPLFIEGKRYGAINIDSTKLAPFSEFHKVIMNYLAKEVELIIERFKMIDEIKYLSTHDFLTGLGNRNILYKYLNKKIDEKEPFYLVQIDLNNFKEINDTYGHLVGDEALKSFADKLKKSETSCEAVRLGGDEFALVFEEKNKTQVEKELKTLHNICKKEGLNIKNHRNLSCGFSCGIAKYPEDGDDIESVYSKSDKVLYNTKRKTLRRRKTDS